MEHTPSILYVLLKEGHVSLADCTYSQELVLVLSCMECIYRFNSAMFAQIFAVLFPKQKNPFQLALFQLALSCVHIHERMVTKKSKIQ
jgi:hypothetical protein